MAESDGERPRPGRLEPAAPAAKVTRLELFYDLVFAYAFLNVATVTTARLTPVSILISLLALALFWSVWTNFALLGNNIRADQGIMPLAGFAIMTGIFILAVAIPGAFGDDSVGPPGDLIFAFCYLLVRVLQAFTFWYSSRSQPQLRRQSRLLSLPALISSAAILLAALLPHRILEGGAELAARIGLWLLGVTVAYAALALIPTEALTIVSASHWAERHAQIILVALGESIISLGLGPGLQIGLPLTWAGIIASALGIAAIAALWWVYFDSLAIAAEEVLHRTHDKARAALARDAYTYLHLPMIAGIILFALGIKRSLIRIARPAQSATSEMLTGIEVHVLYGGVILYFLATTAFQRRTVGLVNRYQMIAVLLLIALIPVAYRLPALAALAVLVLVTIGLVAGLSIRARRPRRELHRVRLEESRELEARETAWRGHQRRQQDGESGRQ